MKDKTILDFEAIVVVDRNIAYASCYEFNGLFKIDLQSEKCEFICMFPGEAVDGRRIHCTAKYVDGKVYFIPASGKYIAIYDVEENIIERLEVPVVESKCSFYKARYKFVNAVVVDNKMWIIPSTYPGILKLNTGTHFIDIIDHWVPDEGYFFRNGLCTEKEKIYIPSGNNNIVLEFNVNNDSGNIHHIGNFNNGCMNMCRHGDEFWLAPRNPGSIISWNFKTNVIKEYSQYPEGFEPGQIVFSKNYCIGDILYFIPAHANMTIEMSINEGVLKKSSFLNFLNESKGEFLFETDNNYYFVFTSFGKKKRLKISRFDNSVEKYEFGSSFGAKKQKEEYFEMSKEQQYVVKENAIWGLEDFIESIVSKQYEKLENYNVKNVGENIWNALK